MTFGPEEQPLLQRTLERMDEAWAGFRARAVAIPPERLTTPVSSGGWSIKQMLAHVWTWHELAIERLSRFRETGVPSELREEADAINARAARSAGGRTTGEILMGMEDSYRRLRHQAARLSDTQLTADAGWAEAIIAGNTYEHYAEHLSDLSTSR